MDKDLYRIMKEIEEKENQNAQEYKKFKVQDVEYIGVVELTEEINGVETKIQKDVYRVIEEMEDGSIVENYYDENKEFIAGRDKNGRMCLNSQELYKDTNIMQQIENLREQPGVTLSQIEENVEKIAKHLGMKKEQVLAMSEVDLEQEVENKGEEEKEDEKIVLEDDMEGQEQSKEEQREQNEETLNNISAKQEIDLNKRVDDLHTLGDILGVNSGAKLIVVYSEAIEDNENTTKFSFIIKNPDGSLENADMLNQVGGKQSDKNVYEVNRDGSNVEKKSVQSSYAINSPIVKNGLITARIGQMGYVEVGYGQIDKTSNKDAMTHELETNQTRYVKRDVQREFSERKGTDNIKENIKEIKEHEKHDCDEVTLREADGNEDTGHKHFEDSQMAEAVEKIKQEHPDVERAFTDEEIQERIEHLQENNEELQKDFEKAVMVAGEDLETDAYYIKTKDQIE